MRYLLLALLLPSRLRAEELPPVGARLIESKWVRTEFQPAAITVYGASQYEQLSFQDKLASRERLGWWRQIKEDICSNIEIPLKKTFDVTEHVRVKPKWHRLLDRRQPGNAPVMVDKVQGRVGFGVSPWEPVAGGMLYASGGFEIDGESYVVRPVKVDKSLCEIFWTIPDVTTIRTAFDMRAAKFKKMAVGEIWELPWALKTTVRAGYGYGAGEFTAGVSFGYSHKGEENLRLAREAEDRLVVEIKVDQAHVFGADGQVVRRIWGSQFDDYRNGTSDYFGEPINGPGPVLFLRDLDDVVLKAVNRFLTVQLRLLAQFRTGQQGLIVFVLDPRDDAQLEALQEVLSGRRLSALELLGKLTAEAAKAYLGRSLGPEALAARADADGARLGRAPEMVALRDYSGWTFPSLRVQFGPLFDVGFSDESQKDRFKTLDGSGSEIHMFRGRTQSHNGWLDVPGVGHGRYVVSRETVITVAETRSQGLADKPAATFVRQLGDNRRPVAEAREDIESHNRLLSLAGSARGLADPGLRLPAAQIFPGAGADPAEPSGRLDRYVKAFTLLLTRPAWEDVLRASDADLMRSYVRVAFAREYKWSEAASELLSGPGPVRFDESVVQARRIWHDGELEQFRNAFRRGELLAEHLADVRRRVDAVAGAKPLGDREFAKLIDRLLDGPNASALKRGDMLEVLLPLIDPKHLAAELVVQADMKAGGQERRIAERFVLNPELEVPGLVERAAKLLCRFSPPSRLSSCPR